jgi:hypothetical protein
MEFVNGRIEEDISMLNYTPEERKATYLLRSLSTLALV